MILPLLLCATCLSLRGAAAAADSCGGGCGLQFEHPLVRQIMLNSSKYVRPVLDQKSPTNVTFRLNLYQILGADTVNQNIHLHFWAEMYWVNEFIFWDPGSFNAIERLDFEDRYIWIPDIMFFNQLSGLHFNEHFPSPPAIFADGLVLVLKPFRVELECKLRVLHFPFDRQLCEFEVGSWAHSMDEIDIVVSRDAHGASNAADLRFFKETSLFRLTRFDVVEFTYNDPELHNKTFSGLRYTVVFYREAAYFVINLIMPSLMINVLCMLNFAIPCQSGEKVGYGITVFLAQSVNLMVVSEMMPQGGMSILGIFLAVSILLIGLSLLMNVITLRIYSPSNKKERPWPRLRLVCSRLKLVVGPRDPVDDTVLAHNKLSSVAHALNGGAGGSHNHAHFEETDVDDPGGVLEPRSPKPPPPPGSGGYRITNNQTQVSLLGLEEDKEFIQFQASSPTLHTSNGHTLSGYKKSSVATPPPSGQQGAPWRRQRKPAVIPPVEALQQIVKQQHDSSGDTLHTRDYTLEWQNHAEIINRFNALIFSLLLLINGILYAVFHSPDTVSERWVNFNRVQ